jgi:uncharacterized lipoprotein YmbA
MMMKKFALILLSAVTLSPVCLAQAPILGDWEGTLDANGTPFRVAWHAVAAQDGSVTSTLDNIDQNIYGIKVKSTEIRDSKLTIVVDDLIQANGQEMNLRGELVGTLNKEETELTATWTQSEPPQPPAPVTMKHVKSQPAPAAAQASIAGDWQGTLNAGQAQLRLVLHITAGKDGALTSSLDSIDQGANGIPVSATSMKESKLSLTVDAVHGTYEGTVNKDASEIDGTWTQTMPLPLKFTRAQPQVAAKPGPPSDVDGTWMGMLDAGGKELRILLKIVNMDTGLTATMQSPDQSPAWIPASAITKSEGKLTVKFNAIAATYEGKITGDLKSVNGTFTQAGHEMPLVLKKI